MFQSEEETSPLGRFNARFTQRITTPAQPEAFRRPPPNQGLA
jgi:hypothetical protein